METYVMLVSLILVLLLHFTNIRPHNVVVFGTALCLLLYILQCHHYAPLFTFTEFLTIFIMKLKLRKARVSSFTMGTCESLVRKEVLPRKQITTTSGIVEGSRHETADGFLSDVFLGIPYAKPPIGELRFKRPQPPEPWTGVRQCRRFGCRSVQNDMFWDKFTINVPQSEDCLYLNIFAPAIDPTKNYPVLFYIHGGGFMMDSAIRYTPKNVCRLLVSHGIVVVTIQYRLGYLGFFCTGDDAAKGNFGLWDQFEALKWTKENIHSFGGDPNQITIGGQSAGGVSTDLLSISPLSRDMFHRKIVMGGSSFNSWAVSSKEEITDYCRQKAIKVGWKPRKEGYSSQLEENESMVEYLRTVPASKFGTHMIGCRVVFEECRLPLAPVIDGEILPKEIPLMRAEAPPKESIVGVGQEESLLFIALDAIKCDGKDMNKLIGALSKKTKKVGQKDITEAIRKLYGYTDMVSYNKKAMRKIFATCLSDVISNYACYRYMQHSQSHMKDTYAYSFDYTSRNMWGWLVPMIPYMAGTHSSDIIYLFDCNYFTAPLPMNKTDRRISQMTSSYFAQFVKKGNPNSEHTSNFEWKPIKKDSDVQMFSICKEPKMLDEVFGNRITQLDSIMAETTLYDNR